MSLYDVYIAMDRRLALANRIPIPTRASGAALVADVSGFTHLTTVLIEELGPEQGAEELTRRLNRVYEALIAEVHRFGGSVVDFSGDAVCCWFDGDDGHGALACGLAMQAAARRLRSAEHSVVAIKVAVAVGPVRRFVVGDPNHRLVDAMAGQTIDRLALAEKRTHPGEVVIVEPAAFLLGDRVQVAERRQDIERGLGFAVISNLRGEVARRPWPECEGLVDGVARRWLIPAVFHRLRRNHGHFLAELRRASALFVSLGDVEHRRSDVLDRRVRLIQSVLGDLGGVLIQLTIGDKGSYLYACFGAPTGHDDDAARSVVAAVTMRDALGGKVRIGLARGLMRVGAYGGHRRYTYGVLGDKTNLAARLMEAAAPGEILVDYETVRTALGTWSFEELPSLHVKGKLDLVRVFRPAGKAGAGGRAGRAAPLVGRQRELLALQAALEQVRPGHNGVFYLEGAAGIGKSRLVAELVADARRRGLVAHVGAGRSRETRSPYRAWRDIIESLLGLRGLEYADRRRLASERVRALLPAAPRSLALLDDILSLGVDGESFRGHGTRQRDLAEVVAALLAIAAGQRTTLVVLEDAQWIDSASWELAERLCRPGADVPPLLLVVVQRGEQPRRLRGAGASERVVLDALDDEASRALAARKLGLGAHRLPGSVERFLRQRGRGNPLLLEELAMTLRDRGLSAAESRGLERLPDTIAGLVLSRIDRLSPEQLLILKIAAVIGPSISYALLRDVVRRFLPISDDEIREHLDVLDRLELTPVQTRDGESGFLFKHSVTQEVVYQTLLFAQRRELHRLAARWYEETFGDRLAPHLDLLVHHFGAAGETERERHYCRLAGSQAAARYANEEALRFLGRALELTPADRAAERFDLLLERERVLALRGCRQQQERDVQAIERLAADLGDEGRRAVAAVRRAGLAQSKGDTARATVAAREALALAQRTGDEAVAAEAYLVWGKALFARGGIEAAREKLVQAMTQGRATFDARRVARCLHHLGRVALEEGNLDEAVNVGRDSLRLCREVGDKSGEGRSRINLGYVAYMRGDYITARSLCRQALELFVQTGDRAGEALMCNTLGVIAHALGHHAEAEGLFQRSLELRRSTDDRAGEAAALFNLGLVAGERGAPDQARDRLHRCRDIIEGAGTGQLSYLGYALTALGEVEIERGDLDRAGAALSDALALRRRLRQPHLTMETRAGLVQLALCLGDRATARLHAESIHCFLPGTLDGTVRPVRIYLACHAAFASVGDPRAAAVLEQGHAFLLERAARIGDQNERRSFLENVPSHRRLLGERRKARANFGDGAVDASLAAGGL